MFEAIEKLPVDPILGLTAAFREDTNPDKIDLGVGVYKDASGNTPVFAAVKQAQQRWQAQEMTKVYIPQAGFADFNAQILPLIFGSAHPALKAQRMQSTMAPGGSGALRISAELLNRCQAGSKLWVSRPTWGNHSALLGSAGLNIQTYPYYDANSHGLLADEMLDTLQGAVRGDIVLIHGGCHNPTGVDLQREHWQAIAALARQNGFLPFVDTAYHGLGQGLEEDVYGIRLLAESVPEMMVAYSCSKNFGLYRERIGAAILLAETSTAAATGLSHLAHIARTMYSLPPAHGGAIVKTILEDAVLRESWQQELAAMRTRIHDLRTLLAATLAAKNAPVDFSFIKAQQGMFSFLGVSQAQVQQLRNEYSIYLLDSSRINVAGVNADNIDYLSDAIVAVL